MALDLAMVDTVLRFGHILAGITWIGMLYWFNLINVGFQKTLDADTKKAINLNLLAPTLFWFRWGAMFTLVFGLALYYYRVQAFGGDFGLYARSNWAIHLGMLLAITMWFNVWFIIWPAQKQVMASLRGDGAAPGADVMRRVYLASRYNTFTSIPMLFLMVSSAHWGALYVSPMDTMNLLIFLVISGGVMALGYLWMWGPLKGVQK